MTSSPLRAIAAAALWILLAAPTDVRAQAAEEPLIPEVTVQTAPVEVDGVVLFRLRGATAYPAAQRAAGWARRIQEAAADPAVGPDDLELVEAPTGLLMKVGPHQLGYVLEADARLEGLSLRELTLAMGEAIKDAIRRYRDARQRVALGTAVVQALVSTAILAVLLALLLPLFRRIDALVQRRFEHRAKKLQEKSFELLRADRIRGMLRGALHAVRVAIVLVLLYLYVSYVFALFPWTRFIAVRLTSWILMPLQTMGAAVLAYIPDFIFLVILVLVVRYALKLLRLFFNGIAHGGIRLEGFDAEWAWPTYKIVRVAVIAFAAVVAYPYIPGSGSEAFKGVSIFAGVIFSLGSTSAISNVVAGYSMTYRRAFRLGDRVKIGDVVGDVTDIRLQVTTIRTPKNEEVVIPNATILNSEIVNYSTLARTQGLILHTTVGIGYEVPWRQVEAMLLMAAERTPGLLGEPAPFVLQRGLADYAVNYELNVSCGDARQMMSLYNALHRSIQDVFNEYGVQIMTPSYEADPAEAKVVPKDRWFAAPAKPPSSDEGGPGA